MDRVDHSPIRVQLLHAGGAGLRVLGWGDFGEDAAKSGLTSQLRTTVSRWCIVNRMVLSIRELPWLQNWNARLWKYEDSDGHAAHVFSQVVVN